MITLTLISNHNPPLPPPLPPQDRGGTFTDVFCLVPTSPPTPVVYKLLSVDPTNYSDAPTEGIRRFLHKYDTPSSGVTYERGEVIYTGSLESIRMGTTVATNALLERKGSRVLNLITAGEMNERGGTGERYSDGVAEQTDAVS